MALRLFSLYAAVLAFAIGCAPKRVSFRSPPEPGTEAPHPVDQEHPDDKDPGQPVDPDPPRGDQKKPTDTKPQDDKKPDDNKPDEKKPDTPPPVEPKPTFDSPLAATVAVCLNPKDSALRKAGLDYMDKFQPTKRDYQWTAVKAGQENCVNYMLPAALFTNLRSGIPVGTLMGQMIQESGWCRTSLARYATNFHAMKKPYKPDKYEYWGGATYNGWMKFSHPDGAFYAVAERIFVQRLPYKNCLHLREKPDQFMRCIGKTWATAGNYATVVLGHRKRYQSKTFPGLTFPKCELSRAEWRLKKPFY